MWFRRGSLLIFIIAIFWKSFRIAETCFNFDYILFISSNFVKLFSNDSKTLFCLAQSRSWSKNRRNIRPIEDPSSYSLSDNWEPLDYHFLTHNLKTIDNIIKHLKISFIAERVRLGRTSTASSFAAWTPDGSWGAMPKKEILIVCHEKVYGRWR